MSGDLQGVASVRREITRLEAETVALAHVAGERTGKRSVRKNLLRAVASFRNALRCLDPPPPRPNKSPPWF